MSAPEASTDDPIEIGRYGVRTFRVTAHRIEPISIHHFGRRPSMANPWDGGVCVAQCPKRGHTAPADHCSCGIYACTDLESLRFQAPVPANRVVAVIAAEGPTVIGDRGFRTSAARIVAYWCSPAHPDTAERMRCHTPDQTREFTDLEDMLNAYRIRATTPPHALRQPVTQFAPAATFATRGAGALGGLSRLLLWLAVVPLLCGWFVAEVLKLCIRIPTSGPHANAALSAAPAAARGVDHLLALALPSIQLWSTVALCAVLTITVAITLEIIWLITVGGHTRGTHEFVLVTGVWVVGSLRAAVWACSYLVAAGHGVPWQMAVATGAVLAGWIWLNYYGPAALLRWRAGRTNRAESPAGA